MTPVGCKFTACMSCNSATCQKVPQMSWIGACSEDTPCKPEAQQVRRPGSALRQVWGFPLANQLIYLVPPPSPEA